MTMRTSGRPAVTGSETDGGTARTFMACRLYRRSQIPGDAQALERVLRLVIHGAAGALGRAGHVELGDDLVDGARLRGDREGDVRVAERAIALAVAREIERDDRDGLAPRIGPDVCFGPMQDRMDAQVRAGRQPGVELVPEFRRLAAHVPLAVARARREDALLGAGRLLVAADAGDQAVEAVLLERDLQAFGLACGRARRGRQRRVDRLDRRARLEQQGGPPL